MTTGAPLLTSTLPGAEGARTIDSVNPADLSDVVARVELAGPQALVEAARRANAAQRVWAQVPPPVRGRVIAAIGRLVEANFEALSQLVTREVGKPIVESRGEVQEIRHEPRFLELQNQIWASLKDEVERAYAQTAGAAA